jgi:hypothetical protein
MRSSELGVKLQFRTHLVPTHALHNTLDTSRSAENYPQLFVRKFGLTQLCAQTVSQSLLAKQRHDSQLHVIVSSGRGEKVRVKDVQFPTILALLTRRFGVGLAPVVLLTRHERQEIGCGFALLFFVLFGRDRSDELAFG